MRKYHFLILALSILLFPKKGFSFSLASGDIYDSTGEITSGGYIITPDGFRRMGSVWNTSRLLEELTSNSVMEAVAKGKSENIQIKDSLMMKNILLSGNSKFEKIDFIYNERFTNFEREFILTQAFCWTFIFGLVELRHPLHEIKPEPYNWKAPFYGLAFGSLLSISLTFSHEKQRIYLKWKPG